MLKKILSTDSCAKCRICCSFVKSDAWETPIIEDKSYNYIINRKEEGNWDRVRLAERGKCHTFEFDFADDTEIRLCPMLDDKKGCILGDDKPFDCKIWSFRVMRDKENLVIAVASICPELGNPNNWDVNAMRELLIDDGLKDRILEEAKKSPDMIKDMEEGYIIV